MGGMLHTELLPVSGAGLNALERQRLSDYLQHVTRDGTLPQSDDEWCRRLTALGLMTEGPGNVSVCTIAGVLMFGHGNRREKGTHIGAELGPTWVT